MPPPAKIIYYTQTCYLDIALEYINALSVAGFEVHVLIELSISGLSSNILSLDINLDNYPALVNYADVKQEWGITHLKDYFTNTASVNFCVYRSNGLPQVLKVSGAVSRYIKKIKPAFIHFDEISPRQMFILPSLIFNRASILLNIHDPKPHTGEFEWKRFLMKKAFLKMVDTIVVFSEYSFAEVKKQLNKKISKINLVPYSVFAKFRTVAPSANTGNNAPIVFIGRVSPYKGIELFLQAIALVVKEFPDQQFIIGGKPIDNYSIEIPAGLSKNITYIARHLENAEIANMVTSAQLVVCPYIEATQSGVIMTAYALECPVLVTNVGGLPEYVIPNQTGFVAQPDAESLARAMVLHLHENKTPIMRNNIKMLTGQLKQANAGFIPNIYNKQ